MTFTPPPSHVEEYSRQNIPFMESNNVTSRTAGGSREAGQISVHSDGIKTVVDLCTSGAMEQAENAQPAVEGGVPQKEEARNGETRKQGVPPVEEKLKEKHKRESLENVMSLPPLPCIAR